jgi:hypothetical protein
MRTYTQTTSTDVISNVTTTITLSSGRTVTGTSLVTSQAMAVDPWYGQVPDELPSLQMMGQ